LSPISPQGALTELRILDDDYIPPSIELATDYLRS
jgi:hypothetical protein